MGLLSLTPAHSPGARNSTSRWGSQWRGLGWWHRVAMAAVPVRWDGFCATGAPEPAGLPAVEGGEDSLVIREKARGPREMDPPGPWRSPTQTITGRPPARTLSSPRMYKVRQEPLVTTAALTSAPCPRNLSEALSGVGRRRRVSLEGSAMGLRQLRLLGFEPACESHSSLRISPLVGRGAPLECCRFCLPFG